MEEPTYPQESLFWDQVADWVLRDPKADVLSREEMSLMARVTHPGDADPATPA
jgi:hypothetical protein